VAIATRGGGVFWTRGWVWATVKKTGGCKNEQVPQGRGKAYRGEKRGKKKNRKKKNKADSEKHQHKMQSPGWGGQKQLCWDKKKAIKKGKGTLQTKSIHHMLIHRKTKERKTGKKQVWKKKARSKGQIIPFSPTSQKFHRGRGKEKKKWEEHEAKRTPGEWNLCQPQLLRKMKNKTHRKMVTGCQFCALQRKEHGGRDQGGGGGGKTKTGNWGPRVNKLFFQDPWGKNQGK